MGRRLMAAAAGAATFVCAFAAQAPAQAQGTSTTPDTRPGATRSDNRPGPRSAEQAQRRAKALALLDKGKARLAPQRGGGATVQLSADPTDVVEFPLDKQDTVFTILSEFGTDGSGKLGTSPGPLHNQIPEPDRTQDNSTYWVADFNRAHYEDLFNGSAPSFKDYYLKQSGGRYTAVNTVTDWVQVPGNASTYGDNAVEDTGGAWQFIRDSADSWYASQVAAGKSAADIDAYLAQFDRWDRYDFDGDGSYNEPDGYIDHFQAVHAGGGEEADAGEDAIWSHRWYAFPTDAGSTGPTVGATAAPNFEGGTRIGGSKYWIGDYTVEPENGGLGVFAHEFGHDLGLPDYYDTDGGENGTGFWTLMSSGSWLSDGAAAGIGIGTVPGGFGPEEKLFLGWLDYAEVVKGQSGTFQLSPSERTLAGADQAVKVTLPSSSRTDAYVTPPAGEHAWWSGRGDDLKNTLTRTIPATAGVAVTVSAQVWYDIEANYDFLYAEYSADGGATWTQVGRPTTGSGTKWASKRWSFKSPVTGDLAFRFRYQTDGGYNLVGAFLDEITTKVGSSVLDTDGAEVSPSAWSPRGWTRSTGTEVTTGARYYLIENRQYVGYDATLKVGPYQFSEAYTRPNWVEFFPYQDGMLVWLVDHGQPDNNTSTHPGMGYALPVDARPDSLTYPDGSSPSNRREPFDATFGLDRVDAVCLHKQVASKVKGNTVISTLEACNSDADRAAKPTFDDRLVDTYYTSSNPQNSVKVANEGVKATVTANTAGTLTVAVSYAG